MDLDRETANRIDAGLPVPQNTFKPSLFRQPSLAEGPIRPKAYRSRVGSKSSSSSKNNTPGTDTCFSCFTSRRYGYNNSSITLSHMIYSRSEISMMDR